MAVSSKNKEFTLSNLLEGIRCGISESVSFSSAWNDTEIILDIGNRRKIGWILYPVGPVRISE